MENVSELCEAILVGRKVNENNGGLTQDYAELELAKYGKSLNFSAAQHLTNQSYC